MSHSTKLQRTMQNEKGITLVEVVASFVILVILLISFYTLFIQTAKTTKSSEDIVDATYIVQTEMERIYNASKNEGINVYSFKALDYQPETVDNSTSEFTKVVSKPRNNRVIDYYINVRLKANNNTNLKNIIIEVKADNNPHDKALMETVVKWKGI